MILQHLMKSTTVTRPSWTGILALGCALVAAVSPSTAADFSVSPMVVELKPGARSAEIHVRNLDKQPIRFQIRGTDWSQDESGKNVYVDSKSLIWFPRAIELAPDESRIVRVGVRATPATKEQAYTVFLQEVTLSDAPIGRTGGAQIRLLLSISVPVFVPPLKPMPGGTIESFELRGGSVEFVVANQGNLHFSYAEAAISGLGADGTEKFTHKSRGKTLLPGSRQQFQVSIPQSVCGQLKMLVLTLTTSERSEIKRRLDVLRADCQ